MNKKDKERIITFAREGFRKFYLENQIFLTDKNYKPGKRTYRNLFSLNKMMKCYLDSGEDYIVKQDVIDKTGWDGPSSYVQHERVITNFGLSDTSWEERDRAVLLLNDEGKKLRDKYAKYVKENPRIDLMEDKNLPKFSKDYLISQILKTTASNMSLWKNTIITALYFYCEIGYLPLYATNRRDIPDIEKHAFIKCFNYVKNDTLMDVSYIKQPVDMLKNLELIDEKRNLTIRGYNLLSKMELLQATDDAYIDYEEMFEDKIDIVEKRVNGSSKLEEVEAPERKSITISIKENTKAARGSHDYSKKHKRDTKIGEIGEHLVLEYERDKLRGRGIANVENLVFLTSESKDYGNSYPCDIVSFDPENNSKIYIEVKTTTEKANTPFYISVGEVTFSKENSESYKLYRVYDVLNEISNPKFFVTTGDVENNYTLVSDRYIAYRDIIVKA